MSGNDEHSKKKNFTLPLSVWLGYLLIATLITGSVTLARYTATTSGDGVMRVASISVSAYMVGGQKELTLTNENNECRFEVKNNSDVSVKYNVIVGNVPNGVNVELTVNNVTVEFSTVESGTLISSANELSIGKTQTCTLVFTTDGEVQSGENGVSVQVRFEQAD